MALPTNNKTAPEFEAGDDESTSTEALSAADQKVQEALARRAAKDDAAASPAATPAATPAETKPASTSTAVAAARPQGGALATSIMDADPFKAVENAIHVDYNTLTQIMVTNGNVQVKETKDLLGDHVGMEVISFQSQWVCSPGGKSEDKEAVKFLKFSDDGKFVKGSDELLTDALADAKAAGYDKSQIVERQILVGTLFYPGVDGKTKRYAADLEDELVQIDLAPRSMGNFKRHRIGAAHKIGRGKLAAEDGLKVKMSCSVQSKNGNNWTDAVFDVWTAEDEANAAAVKAKA